MDQAAHLLDAIRQAAADGRQISITGAGSKRHLLPEPQGEMLSTLEHTGITSYEPAELVVTALAGTPLRELNLELNQANQVLAAEPPMFAGDGTVGGAVAAGLSGPARPWKGALRDAVLGAQLINGCGELLNFGGQVMKNVAGYDVSRLVAGAYGGLGLITSVSLRVHPKPDQEITLAFDMDAQQAVEQCCSIKRLPLPVSGSIWLENRLYLRFSGSEASIHDAMSRLGGELLKETNLWSDVRDHRLSFFQSSDPLLQHAPSSKLWRVVTPPAAALPPPMDLCIEWGGGLRWIWETPEQGLDIPGYAAAVGGWAWQIGGDQVLPEIQQRVMQSTRKAFNPEGIFVPGVNFYGS